MAGIYIHIPFCKKACHYCNFHFSTSLSLKNDFLRALLKELELRKTYLKEPVSTVYFGGGTPSLLEIAELEWVLGELRQQFEVMPGAELTLEANPDDITEEKLIAWKAAGINRLSIGVQSFFDHDLRWMNRAHNASQSKHALKLALDHFDNITVDLIYGVPGLSDAGWKENVQTAIRLGIPHLSCYALTVEPKTALQKMIEQHRTSDVNSNDQARQFLLLMEWTQESGYEHYEISNFALPGKRSRHNSSYWRGVPYIGLGPSAHSFNGSSRQWNVANNALYIKSLLNGQLNYELETLTDIQRLNEYIMTSLRTSEGVGLDHVEENFGTTALERLKKSAKQYIDSQQLVMRGNQLVLSNEGKLFADGIAADLFVLE